MADIAIGVFGHAGAGGSPSSATIGFDTSGMVNQTLLVGLYTSGTTADGVASITYNSVAMTRVNSQTNSVDATERSYMYILPGAPAGNYNIVITFQNSIASYETAHGSYQNTNTNSQPDTQSTGGGVSASSLQLSCTSSTDRCWMVGFWRAQLTLSNGANTTMRDTYAGINHALADTNGVVTPAGAKTLTLTTSPAAGWSGNAIMLKPESPSLPRKNTYLMQAIKRSSSY